MSSFTGEKKRSDKKMGRERNKKNKRIGECGNEAEGCGLCGPKKLSPFRGQRTK